MKNKYFEDQSNFMRNVTFPYIYQIEVTERCNLQCPACLNQFLKNKQDIKLDLIDIIIENDYLKNTLYTELQQSGEPTLHSNLKTIIQRIKGTGTLVGLSTNLTKVDMDILNTLDAITISFDVFDQKLYEESRYPAKWIKFLENLDLFLKEIDNNILVHIQLLLTKWTQNKFEESKNKLEEFLSKYNKYNLLIRYADDCFIENRDEKLEKKIERNMCLNPFLSVSIKVDGTVIPCCFDFEKSLSLGNLYIQDLRSIWEGEKVNYLRNCHQVQTNLPIKCKKCYYRSPILLMHSFATDLIKFRQKEK